MERTQFTFYRSFYEAIRELPKKEQTAVLMAICEYALDGVEPKLSGVSSAIFTLIKPNLDTAAKRAENGRSGGSKREANAKQNESKCEAKAKQKRSEKEREKEEEKEKENEIEREDDSPLPQTPSLGDDRDELVSFDDFWKRYPKKVAKKAAIMAWKKLKAEDRLRIIPALETQSKSSQWLRDGGQYVPNPATWLNGRRWEDEIDTSPQKTKGQVQFEQNMSMIDSWLQSQGGTE